MNRRGFLGSVLAAMAAPAIVRAESLMPIWVPNQEILTPGSFELPVRVGPYDEMEQAVYKSLYGVSILEVYGVPAGQRWINMGRDKLLAKMAVPIVNGRNEHPIDLVIPAGTTINELRLSMPGLGDFPVE